MHICINLKFYIPHQRTRSTRHATVAPWSRLPLKKQQNAVLNKTEMFKKKKKSNSIPFFQAPLSPPAFQANPADRIRTAFKKTANPNSVCVQLGNAEGKTDGANLIVLLLSVKWQKMSEHNKATFANQGQNALPCSFVCVCV